MNRNTPPTAISTPDPGRVTVQRSAGIATVSMRNAGRRNALNQAMCQQLEQVMVELDQDPEVLVIALCGYGADFSAGAALNDLDAVLFAPDGRGGTIDHLSRADAAIRATRKPTVALVRGICMGGGWQIAAACDLLLAADDCRIAITPSKLGILYPRAGLERLVARVGAHRAKFLLYTAAELSPQKAVEWGLVTELYSAGSFDEEVARVLQSLCQRSQYSSTTMGALIDAVPSADLDRQWELAWKEFQHHEDLAVGRAAFLAGRVPVFSWRLP